MRDGAPAGGGVTADGSDGSDGIGPGGLGSFHTSPRRCAAAAVVGLWRFFVALSRRDSGVVEVVDRGGEVLGTVVLVRGELAYVAMPGDRRYLGEMLIERRPELASACRQALEKSRSDRTPFAQTVVALAPHAADDVQGCLHDQAVRRLVVLAECMRTGAVGRFTELPPPTDLQLTVQLWDAYVGAAGQLLPPGDDPIARWFACYSLRANAGLLLVHSDREAAPLDRAWLPQHSPAGIDELVRQVQRLLDDTALRSISPRPDVIVSHTDAGWSMLWRGAELDAWLCTSSEQVMAQAWRVASVTTSTLPMAAADPTGDGSAP